MWAVLQKLTWQELAEGMLRHLSHLESQVYKSTATIQLYCFAHARRWIMGM